MKLEPPRLLPIVIAAAAALLLFKGIGLITGGAYVLTGTTPAIAAGGGEAAAGGATEGPTGPNMTDTSPTLEDGSVTMEFPAGGSDSQHKAALPVLGPADPSTGLGACPPIDPATGAPNDPEGPCIPDPGVNEHGDALPLIKDNASGNLVPLADVMAAASSENAISDRLAERRDQLEQLEQQLDMRASLLEAAEKRLEERTAELKALEEKVNKLVDANQTAEKAQFVGLVAMYETMKPKDAATIFNELGMPVLLGVAKAMNPRKMSPILARMDPLKAKALTDAIAADEETPPTTEAAVEDITNLPQIVGQ